MSASRCQGRLQFCERTLIKDIAAEDATSVATRLSEGHWYMCVLEPSGVLQWWARATSSDVETDEEGADKAVFVGSMQLRAIRIPGSCSIRIGEKGGGTSDTHMQRIVDKMVETEDESPLQYPICFQDDEGEFIVTCDVESLEERQKWQGYVESSEVSSTHVTDHRRPNGNSSEQYGPHRQFYQSASKDIDSEDAFGLLFSHRKMAASVLSDVDDRSQRVFNFDHMDENVSSSIEEKRSKKKKDVERQKSHSSSDAESSGRMRRVSSLTNISFVQENMRRSSTGMEDTCHRCNVRLGWIISRGKECQSCRNRFCKEHCSNYCVLTSIRRSSQDVRRSVDKSLVCTDCMERQRLLTLLDETIQYYDSVVRAGGLSKLVRWRFFSHEPKYQMAKHLQSGQLGPMGLLAAMYKYKNHPFMLQVVLAQLIKNVEYCVDVLDFYWPQFLSWGFCHLMDAPPSSRALYLFFLAAVCRRCVPLAVKTTWECLAAHWDAMTSGDFSRGFYIVCMLFFTTHVTFGVEHSVLHELLFATAPDHQRRTLESKFLRLYNCSREVYVHSQRDTPFYEWVLARTDVELGVSSKQVRQQLYMHRNFLDPFPARDVGLETIVTEEDKQAIQQRQLDDTTLMEMNAPALQLFGDTFQLVSLLTDLTIYLKQSVEVPSDRKKELPALLEEMKEGDCVRPASFLPLDRVTKPLHTIVQLLSDQGTVFSTKERAPTLVYFEAVRSNLEHAALDERFRREGNPHTSSSASLLRESMQRNSTATRVLGHEAQVDILNYLDGNVVESYVRDLVTVETDNEDTGSESTYSESPMHQSTGPHFLSNRLEDKESPDPSDSDISQVSEEESIGDSATSTSCHQCAYFGEPFDELSDRLREQSAYGQYEGWSLMPVIAKSFDDMRQEVFVLQGVKLFQLIFQKHHIDLWMKFYTIVCTGRDCGVMETIVDAQSIDGLKKKAHKLHQSTSLAQIFQTACGRDPWTGEPDPLRLEQARRNFISSMAAYSLFSYIFLVKDRHNGNIMLQRDGHVVHIDFGFVLGIAPGNSFSRETAPFKFTAEMAEIMGPAGVEEFRQLVHQGLMALHLEAKQIISLVSLSSKISCFPCFISTSPVKIIRRLKRRLGVDESPEEIGRMAGKIVDKSLDHLGTRQYDWFQYKSNGILA